MVTILPQKRSPFELLANAMSQFGQNAPRLLEQKHNRQLLKDSLDEIKNLANDPNAKPIDTLLATLKAGAGIPGSERYLSALAPEVLRLSQANVAQKAPLAGEQEGDLQAPQRQELPSFMNQQKKIKEAVEYFPTNVGPKEDVGSIPQEATTGKKLPLLSPDQYAQAAKKLSGERTKLGIPTTPTEALEEVKRQQEDIKLHNAKVDEELSQQKAGQQAYGARAVEHLKKAFGNEPIPPEVEAYFAEKGENKAKEGKSEAQIDRYLSEEAKKLANSVSNIKQSASAPRLLNSLTRSFNGTYKNFEDSAKDLQKLLKPLLDAQLYDYSRGLLSDLGYYPEEREIIVNPLTQRSQNLLNSITNIPRLERPVSLGIPGVPTAKDPNSGDLQTIKTSLMELKRIEPNFSLPLSRKMFEDKGYGWRTYKDALNELMDEGFTLEDDQRTQLGFLDSPPESRLEEILRSINLTGR